MLELTALNLATLVCRLSSIFYCYLQLAWIWYKKNYVDFLLNNNAYESRLLEQSVCKMDLLWITHEKDLTGIILYSV